MDMWFCSRTCRTPRCANPRAKPPPSARPTPVLLDMATALSFSTLLEDWPCLVMLAGSQGTYPLPMVRGFRNGSTSVLRWKLPVYGRSDSQQYLLTSPLTSLYHCDLRRATRFSLSSG